MPADIVHGAIKYDERRTPLARASQILDEELAKPGAFVAERRGAWEPLFTIEGEYATAITVHGHVAGSPAQRDYGIVFLDDAYALVSGYCIHEAAMATFAAHVRELTRGDRHFLGVRRRRCKYAPPPGWREVERGFTTELHAADGARITVFPAMPRRALPASAILDAAGRGERECYAVGELVGERFVAVDDRATHTLIVLEDDDYTYGLRLDANTAAHDETFAAVVDSVQPFPRAPRNITPAIVQHWAE